MNNLEVNCIIKNTAVYAISLRQQSVFKILKLKINRTHNIIERNDRTKNKKKKPK